MHPEEQAAVGEEFQLAGALWGAGLQRGLAAAFAEDFDASIGGRNLLQRRARSKLEIDERLEAQCGRVLAACYIPGCASGSTEQEQCSTALCTSRGGEGTMRTTGEACCTHREQALHWFVGNGVGIHWHAGLRQKPAALS